MRIPFGFRTESTRTALGFPVVCARARSITNTNDSASYPTHLDLWSSLTADSTSSVPGVNAHEADRTASR